MEQTILNQISEAIADVEGVDPVNLDMSIQRYISTDAIQDLVNHGGVTLGRFASLRPPNRRC
ncbi:hypothetical protein, partial [Halorubrum sp. CBA1125]|uniref:hypothetical protein n=1 Tax=Halorubrum sp. CBA1125 TaxID=2668072 RepID=UPI0037440FD1